MSGWSDVVLMSDAAVTTIGVVEAGDELVDVDGAVDDVVEELPVLRPLIGSDKVEIIERAQELGTFELSSQPATDCCTLFMPRRPETHARLPEVRAAWDMTTSAAARLSGTRRCLDPLPHTTTSRWATSTESRSSAHSSATSGSQSTGLTGCEPSVLPSPGRDGSGRS